MAKSNEALIAAAVLGGVAVLAWWAKQGPNKRPSVDGMPVYQNGNGRVQEPGDRKGPAYCGTEARCC